MIRKAIYAALFAKMSGIGNFVTMSRRLKHWTDVGPEMQPALFMAENDEAPEQQLGLPTKWRLTADVHLYLRADQDPEIPSGDEMSDLLDAAEAALKPEPGIGKQTLGGLVQHCWISGSIIRDGGVLGDQMIAIIPIEMLAV